MRSLLIALTLFATACGSSGDQTGDSGSDSGAGDSDSAVTSPGKVIFVIPMENQDYAKVIGDMTNAPYINGTLVPAYASASTFQDELPLSIPSEPHYVWMESGTNAFADHTFTNDGDSSTSNSTNSGAHLTTQLETAGISWMTYQEDIAPNTCPISSSGFYAAKHDPFVFFQDVVGATPSASDAHCIAHHKPFTALAADLKDNAIAAFNFVTPNLCNDMHGASGCAQPNTTNANIKAGDAWLQANLQPMIDFALARDGYVFVVWDEGNSTNLIPFIAIGKRSIAGHVGAVQYTHSSLLKSEEEILGVPILPSVASATDFADLFQGAFP